MPNRSADAPSPWRWIPSLYFAQGLPYVAVMTLSVVMYKNLRVSNADIALYTSLLYLPWVIKPLWSPWVDLRRTKRFWIVALQAVVGAALALVALLLPGPLFFRSTLAVLWLLAFASATHDIAADGFYLLALPSHRQAAFVGVRSTCYRIAMIAGQGGLVGLAGWLETRGGDVIHAWIAVFGLAAAFFVAVAAYHAWALPRPANDGAPVARVERDGTAAAGAAEGFFAVFVAFFRKPGIGAALAFLLLYRFAEAQLLKLVTPFLLDPRPAGGLGLRTEDVGFVYGTLGVAALIAGGLLGGVAIARFGLKRMLWPMLLAMYAPNLAFIALALAQPSSLGVIGAALMVEQFGYGFGFTAYMLTMMLIAEGPHRTAHYAICTGFMALGMMVPGMWSGWLQEKLGYVAFFIWVCVATVPSFLATAAIKVDPAFGRKTTGDARQGG